MQQPEGGIMTTRVCLVCGGSIPFDQSLFCSAAHSLQYLSINAPKAATAPVSRETKQCEAFIAIILDEATSDEARAIAGKHLYEDFGVAGIMRKNKRVAISKTGEVKIWTS